MADTERRILKGKFDRGGAPVWGCLSMGCSTPLLFLGWPAFFYKIKDEDGQVLQPFLTVIGFMLFVYGCFFMLAGVRNLFEKISFLLRKKKFPDEPWKYDYKWNPEGYANKPWNTVLYYVKMFFLFTVFILPWNMFAFHPEMPWFIMVIVGLFIVPFDIVILSLGFKAVQTWWKWYSFGVPYIWYDHFPYHPGEEMTVGLGATIDSGPYPELKVTLQLVEEIPGSGGKDSGRTSFHLWSETQTLSDPEGFILGEKEPIPITFQLPDDRNPTALSKAHAFFWELKVEVPDKKGDFSGVFLIPVYEKVHHE